MEKRVRPANDQFFLIDLTADIVSAYVANNKIKIQTVDEVIGTVYSALSHAELSSKEAPAILAPAVPIKKSVYPDYLVCLEDGLKLKMLKRHLRTSYGLTPEQYRAKWGLPPDYPMAAPNYTLSRSEFAKKSGFGTRKVRKWAPRRMAAE